MTVPFSNIEVGETFKLWGQAYLKIQIIQMYDRHTKDYYDAYNTISMRTFSPLYFEDWEEVERVEE